MPPSPGWLSDTSVFAVVLAGGAGTRLWPRSRRSCPKQLLDVVDQRTMLQNTVERVRPLVPAERTFVVTGAEYLAQVREQLPDIPTANILAEPAGRGTAPSIGLAAVALSHLAPQGIMISLHADHVITNPTHFRELLQIGVEAASAGQLVTLGIKPTYPETGYGYIEQGQLLRHIRGVPIFRVNRFVEKPCAELAAEYVRGGNHCWNSGLFIWRVDTILQAMQQWLPELYEQLMLISQAWNGQEREKVFSQVWEKVHSVSIDVGIMEKAKDIVVVPADIGWSDVGSWASLAQILATTAEGNVVLGGCEHLGIDTHNSLVYASSRLVATIGLRDLVIVDTGDVLLVCPKSRAQDVKLLVEQLRAAGRHDLT